MRKMMFFSTASAILVMTGAVSFSISSASTAPVPLAPAPQGSADLCSEISKKSVTYAACKTVAPGKIELEGPRLIQDGQRLQVSSFSGQGLCRKAGFSFYDQVESGDSRSLGCNEIYCFHKKLVLDDEAGQLLGSSYDNHAILKITCTGS